MAAKAEGDPKLNVQVGTQIGVLTDELTRQLERAQDAIRRRMFAVSAGVVLRCGVDEEGAGKWQESLCFGKLGGEWQLYVQSGFTDDPQSLTKIDLSKANLDTRLLAARKIPVLVQALEAVQADRVDEITSAVRDLSSFVDRLLRADG
jgi:hypothetical protein